MKKTLLALCAAGIAMATAATPAMARDGCGPGGHRGPYGHCRPNRGGYYNRGPGYNRGPEVRLVIGNYYHGRGYWDGRRYYQNRYRHNGGWRYR